MNGGKIEELIYTQTQLLSGEIIEYKLGQLSGIYIYSHIVPYRILYHILVNLNLVIDDEISEEISDEIDQHMSSIVKEAVNV